MNLKIKILAALGLLLAMTRTLAAEPATSEYRRILVSAPINIYPPAAEDIHSLQVLAQTAEGLMKFENHRLVPSIAESYEISTDLKTYRFKLRSDARFSDGRVINVEDVRSSLEHIFSSELVIHSDISVIQGAEEFRSKKNAHLTGFVKIDDRNFEIRLKSPFVPILETFASANFAIIPAESLKILNSKKLAPFVSSGPYTLKRVTADRLELEKNPFYRNAASVFYERLSYDIVSDRAAAVRGFNAGKYDDIWPHVIEKDETKILLNEIPSLTAFSWYIICNLTRGPLQHLELRRFLLARLDYDTFLKKSGLPPSYRAYGIIPRGMLGYQASRPIPESFGSEKNLNKYCSKAKPCELDIIHAYERQSELEALIAPLKPFEDRLKIHIVKMDRHPWYQRLISADFDAVYLGNNTEYPDSYIFLRYLVKSVYHPGLKAKEINRELERALATSDRVERSAIYNRVDNLVMDQVGVIPIYHGDLPSRQVRADIDGYEISLMGYHELSIAKLKPKAPQ